MLAEWKLIETIENQNKKNERVEICLYQRGSDFSFGTGVFLKNMGWATPVMEGSYIYKSKDDAIRGAVAFIKERVEAGKDYKEQQKVIYKMLPSIEFNLFDF
jgi:hypothetical protein